MMLTGPGMQSLAHRALRVLNAFLGHLTLSLIHVKHFASRFQFL